MVEEGSEVARPTYPINGQLWDLSQQMAQRTVGARDCLMEYVRCIFAMCVCVVFFDYEWYLERGRICCVDVQVCRFLLIWKEQRSLESKKFLVWQVVL